MTKISVILSLIILVYIIPLTKSLVDVNNSTENFTQNLNNSDEINGNNETIEENNDPFKDIDFGNVITLTDDNMTAQMKKDDILFMAFYAPWCENCHSFLIEFVATSRYAEEKNLTVKFSKIDVSECERISDDFKLEQYPTVYLVIKEKKYIYEGERTKEALLKFLNRKLNDDVFQVKTLNEINEYVKNSSFVLLSTLTNLETVLYQSFLNYSKTALNIEFLKCSTEECIKEYKNDIVLFKKFDEKINKYTKDFGNIADAHINSVKEFFATFGVEAGGILNDTQINMMIEHKRKMLFYFRNSSDDEQTKNDKIIKELGFEFRKKKIYTVICDIQGNPFFENIGNTFVIVPKDLPTLLFYVMKPNSTIRDMPDVYSIRDAKKEQLKKEYIEEYINKIKDGKIKTDLFSEPPLDNYYINGLKYIIGRNYDKDVIEEENNVLLNFIEENMYCPECYTILNIMTNLTKKYAPDKKVIFAYIDVGKNQPRGINLANESAPLVFLYANTLPEKKIIKMTHKNWTEINEEYIENFLSENLNWVKNKKVTNNEKVKQNEESKKEEKKEKENKKEEKKDKSTDL